MDTQHYEPMRKNNGDWRESPDLFRSLFSTHRSEEYIERSLDRMYIGSAPTMRQVRDIHGDNTINAWLTTQISYMFEHTDVKTDQDKTNSLIRLIRAKYQFLKVTEFMHYVFLFRTGEFGKIYGKADGQTVMLSLKDYMKTRDEILSDIARRKAEEEMAQGFSDSRSCSARESRVFLDVLNSDYIKKFGEWRKEPWAPLLSRAFFVHKTMPVFPGDIDYETRRRWAESLGYADRAS